MRLHDARSAWLLVGNKQMSYLVRDALAEQPPEVVAVSPRQIDDAGFREPSWCSSTLTRRFILNVECDKPDSTLVPADHPSLRVSVNHGVGVTKCQIAESWCFTGGS